MATLFLLPSQLSSPATFLHRNWSSNTSYAVSFPAFAAIATASNFHPLFSGLAAKTTLPCSACGHFLHDVNHLFDCPVSEPLLKYLWLCTLCSWSLMSGSDLGVQPDFWVFAEFLRAPIPQKESDNTTKTSSSLGKNGKEKVVRTTRFSVKTKASSPRGFSEHDHAQWPEQAAVSLTPETPFCLKS